MISSDSLPRMTSSSSLSDDEVSITSTICSSQDGDELTASQRPIRKTLWKDKGGRARYVSGQDQPVPAAAKPNKFGTAAATVAVTAGGAAVGLVVLGSLGPVAMAVGGLASAGGLAVGGLASAGNATRRGLANFNRRQKEQSLKVPELPFRDSREKEEPKEQPLESNPKAKEANPLEKEQEELTKEALEGFA